MLSSFKDRVEKRGSDRERREERVLEEEEKSARAACSPVYRAGSMT